MQVIFFEDFSSDTYSTIGSRYPDARLRPAALGAVLPFTVPLQRLATGTGAGNDMLFPLGNVASAPDRLDVLLRLADNGNTTSSSANNLLVLYNNIRVHAISATRLRIDGGSSSTEVEFDVPSVKDVAELYIVVDYVNQQLTVTVDRIPRVVRAAMNWSFVPGVNVLVVDAVSTSVQSLYFPNMLESVVVATDLPAGQMLDTATVEFLASTLTVEEVQDAEYTDEGFVEDVDKQNPELADPGVRYDTEGLVVYGVTTDVNALASKVYTAGRSDYGRYLVVGDEVTGTSKQLGTLPRVLSPLDTTGVSSIPARIVNEVVEWVSNGQGLEYAGESDLISYRDLETLLGFTTGEANPENTWLHVRLDGVEMYVAKTPLRYSVSWDQIYAAGLVYGTDDNGLYPTGTPTNQLRIVTINGVDYKVRLLKGADTDPVNLRNSGNDVVGTRESEWSRIFYPLCSDDPNVTSYTGPKLAEFTMADLWMLDAAAYLGRYSWCQETLLDYPVNRVIRGLRGPSRFTRTDSTSTVTARGWRPVLVRLA